MRKIAIVGSRPSKVLSEENTRVFDAILDDVYRFVMTLPEDTMIVSGGAVGVDRAAVEVARFLGMPIKEFLPNYGRYPRKLAPIYRNTEIVEFSDEVHCWPSPWSTGTWDALRKAERYQKGFKHPL